jgi:DNA-directed RNA polymerase III subunit RPC3
VLVLVQHNILWHAHSEDEGEVLEINMEECLVRLRFGRFVWQAGQLFGEPVSIYLATLALSSHLRVAQGAEIVQLILDNGKLRPPDIVAQLSPHDAKGLHIFSLHGSCSDIPKLPRFTLRRFMHWSRHHI